MRKYAMGVDVPEIIGQAIKEVERVEEKEALTLTEKDKFARLKRILRQGQVLSKELAE